MLNFLHHLFVPRESNNHRAKILHAQPLFFLVAMLLTINFMTPRIEQRYPSVLGITANVSVDELVNLTNQQRVKTGLSPLTLNPQLTQAAQLKERDMFTKNYWSHNAPDGTTPWSFIKSAGYEYVYAGENLARGFTTASEAVNAWMASPGHRDNIMSPNYKEIGFAVGTGSLTGDETVLIVQMFGSSSTAQAAIGLPAVPTVQPTIVAQVLISPTLVPTAIPTTSSPVISNPIITSVPEQQSFYVAGVSNQPVIDTNTWFRIITIAITSVFIFIFILDIIVIERKQIVRLVSHNLDHLMFLIVILLVLLLFGRGVVL